MRTKQEVAAADMVCALSFYTAYDSEHRAPDQDGYTEGSYYRKGDRYRGDEIGPRIHPEWFVPFAQATGSALAEIEGRNLRETLAASDRVREATERKMRPEPPKVFAEHEYLICIKQLGVETHGGRAPSHLVLIGSLAPPDSPWVKMAPKCWRSVLPKGAKPAACLVCTETHGNGRGRLYAGEFVRRDDQRVAINGHLFREPRLVPEGGGWKTWPMGGYVTESTS